MSSAPSSTETSPSLSISPSRFSASEIDPRRLLSIKVQEMGKLQERLKQVRERNVRLNSQLSNLKSPSLEPALLSSHNLSFNLSPSPVSPHFYPGLGSPPPPPPPSSSTSQSSPSAPPSQAFSTAIPPSPSTTPPLVSPSPPSLHSSFNKTQDALQLIPSNFPSNPSRIHHKIRPPPPFNKQQNILPQRRGGELMLANNSDEEARYWMEMTRELHREWEHIAREADQLSIENVTLSTQYNDVCHQYSLLLRQTENFFAFKESSLEILEEMEQLKDENTFLHSKCEELQHFLSSQSHSSLNPSFDFSSPYFDHQTPRPQQHHPQQQQQHHHHPFSPITPLEDIQRQDKQISKSPERIIDRNRHSPFSSQGEGFSSHKVRGDVPPNMQHPFPHANHLPQHDPAFSPISHPSFSRGLHEEIQYLDIVEDLQGMASHTRQLMIFVQRKMNSKEHASEREQTTYNQLDQALFSLQQVGDCLEQQIQSLLCDSSHSSSSAFCGKGNSGNEKTPTQKNEIGGFSSPGSSVRGLLFNGDERRGTVGLKEEDKIGERVFSENQLEIGNSFGQDDDIILSVGENEGDGNEDGRKNEERKLSEKKEDLKDQDEKIESERNEDGSEENESEDKGRDESEAEENGEGESEDFDDDEERDEDEERGEDEEGGEDEARGEDEAKDEDVEAKDEDEEKDEGEDERSEGEDSDFKTRVGNGFHTSLTSGSLKEAEDRRDLISEKKREERESKIDDFDCDRFGGFVQKMLNEKEDVNLTSNDELKSAFGSNDVFNADQFVLTSSLEDEWKKEGFWGSSSDLANILMLLRSREKYGVTLVKDLKVLNHQLFEAQQNEKAQKQEIKMLRELLKTQLSESNSSNY